MVIYKVEGLLTHGVTDLCNKNHAFLYGHVTYDA